MFVRTCFDLIPLLLVQKHHLLTRVQQQEHSGINPLPVCSLQTSVTRAPGRTAHVIFKHSVLSDVRCPLRYKSCRVPMLQLAKATGCC